MKHCKIHSQDYMDFLHECPVCGGERLGRETKDGIQAFSKALSAKYCSMKKAIREQMRKTAEEQDKAVNKLIWNNGYEVLKSRKKLLRKKLTPK